MEKIDFVRMSLNRRIEAGVAANEKLAADIVKLGICSRRSWIKEPMQLDADGREAARALAKLDSGVDPAALVAEYDKEISQELGWLIPSNFDSDADIFRLQAKQKVRQDAAYLLSAD